MDMGEAMDEGTYLTLSLHIAVYLENKEAGVGLEEVDTF